MIIAAFFISTAVVILLLGALQAGRNAKREQERKLLADELRSFLGDAHVPDPEHASGTWRDMKVEITIGHYSIDYVVTLVPAVIPYRDLMAKHAPQLEAELARDELRLDAKDQIHGSVPRETGLAENLVTVETRLALAQEVRLLRRFAPALLLERVERARSSVEVDATLIELAKHFPDAPEMELAIERAAEREHEHPDRVRERAQRWLGRGLATA